MSTIVADASPTAEKHAWETIEAAALEEVTYPEGGYGWVVVAASAAIFFNGWGLSNAWGAFLFVYSNDC